jgi:phosphatidate cytidylyltransferase
MALSVRNIGIRAGSALVLAPAAIAAIWVGGYLFLALMLAACALLATEWARMSAPKAWRRVSAAITLALTGAVLATFSGELSLGLVFLVFSALAAGLYVRRVGVEPIDAAYGVFYLGWPAVLLIWLRGPATLDGATTESGFWWTVVALVLTWSADIFAYLAGSLIGGPKLWPRFSPNKTWSGFVGGLVAGVVAGHLLGPLLGIAWGALLGLAAALATMAGDLWESALKRRFGVKDAGNIIPGHGGLLDRVDGLMFAVVVVASARLIVILLERSA